MSYLDKIVNRINELKQQAYPHPFQVPTLWLEQFDSVGHTVELNPFDFFEGRIARIKQIAAKQPNALTADVVYNMFVRLATAFDHRQAGSLHADSSAFKQTGTFLKAIALLPYLKSLGVSTVYLLPITSIGKYGNKGDLGSPYSIQHHYKIDENLSEPLLQMPIEEQFSAFVEASQMLGIKVILEFVFRTSSLDSELAIEHPEWFYWIKDNGETFHPPKFEDEELILIKEKVNAGDLTELLPPHKSYVELFDTPHSNPYINDNGKIQAKAINGELLTVPNAFADWPPDDKQPLWSDVTYLKLYDNPKFNYIAYNTVRMYDNELSQEQFENAPLWQHIIDVIPFYINSFGIDGVMIDMGHSLPTKLRNAIVSKARAIKQDFIFWEENFVVSQKSKDEGYDAVLGYIPFDAHQPWKLKNIIRDFANKAFPIEFFLTAETHNTKRAASRNGGINFSKLLWSIFSFLPGLKFIHNGFELGETAPVNTGLGFELHEIAELPAEKLPLFSSAVLNWVPGENIVDYIAKFNAIADYYKDEIGTKQLTQFKLLDEVGENVVAFLAEEKILICGNFSGKPCKINLSELLPNKQIEMYFTEGAQLSLAADSCNIDAYGLLIAIVSDCD